MAGKSEIDAVKSQNGSPPAKRERVVKMDPLSDRDAGPNSLQSLAGSQSKALNNVLLNQVIGTVWLHSGLAEDERSRRTQASLAAMMEFKATDAIEGMMAAQAVGLHFASMECLRRAMIPEQPGLAADQLRRQGANLSRAFLDVLAALDRKRGKGVRQIVRVERVMVAPGGQAIVGNIETSPSGGMKHGEGTGHGDEIGEEPHATPAGLAQDPAAGAVLPSMWSADSGRESVPVPCNGQRALPDARRHQHGA